MNLRTGREVHKELLIAKYIRLAKQGEISASVRV